MLNLTSLFILAIAIWACLSLPDLRGEEAPMDPGQQGDSAINLLPHILPDQAMANHRQQLTLILPGIGGRSDRSIAIQVNVVEGKVVGNPQVRSWTFQDRLQPSHIRRLERQVTAIELEIDEQRIHGHLSVRMAGPRQLGNPEVEFLAQVRVDLRLSPGPAPMLREDFSTPPWRRVDFPLHGKIFQGSYEGTWTRNQQAPEHRFHAAWASLQNHLQRGGSSRSEGDWPSQLTVTDEGKLFMHADLPDRPVGASESATQRWQLAQPLSLGKANALRLRWRSAAHPDVAAQILINDRLGQQWSYPRSLPLLGNERETILPLAGFQPDWYTATFDLETDVITGFGLSIPAGNGPGPVGLELLSVEALFIPELSRDHQQARIHLQPDRALVSEGQSLIHPALFGVHGVGRVPEHRHEDVATMGIGGIRTIEHSGFNPRSGAVANEELRHLVEATGSNMSEAIHSFTMGLFDPPPWMNNDTGFLDRLRAFGRSLGQHGYDPELRPNDVQWVEFWNEPFIWGRHINRPYSTIIDPEQHGHYAGPLAARQYAAMYRAMVEEARAINPHLRFAGPSSSGFGSDDWRQLTTFVLPIVEKTHDILDAVAEHHYQGRGRQFAAEWLVADAAIQVIAGRSIPIWNTETNDLSDTPGGWGDSDDRPARAAERKRAAYQIDEILAHLQFIPHLARGRAIHMLHRGRFLNSGEAVAVQFLAPLRGTLVMVESSDPRLSVVAAHDGEALQIIAYNDRHHPVAIEWTEAQPQALRQLIWDAENGSRVIDLDAPPAAIPPLGAVHYRLDGPPPKTMRQRQIRPARAADNSPGILLELPPGSARELIFANLPSGYAKEIWVVSEGLRLGGGSLVLANGQEININIPHDGLRKIRRIPLPRGVDLSQGLQVRAHADGVGWRLAALSAVWEEDHEDTADATP